ncbi:hypothetical protein Pcinc_003409 [Petrolisthes cinctipes]|uniref:Uncharacterized protein n=1 Tax=Petrolisthes cinctipes TaxID=88211 RepID=A0AAE1L193_PETCI|nr:hypothetical protein Pcinc_003409 [Petrolisthes cinctipes]
MEQYTTVELMVAKNNCGWVCDNNSLVKLGGLASYDSAVFKTRLKIDGYLALFARLSPIEFFTLDVIVEDNDCVGDPDSRNMMFSGASEECQARGCDGMLTLGLVNTSCMPNNGARVRYSLAQFVDSLVQGVESYYMFQNFSPHFSLNATGLWDPAREVKMTSGYIILAWKLKNTSTQEIKPRAKWTTADKPRTEKRQQKTLPTPVVNISYAPSRAKRYTQLENNSSHQVPLRKRGRSSNMAITEASSTEEEEEEMMEEEEEEEEEDEEITFKFQPAQPSPVKLPEVIYSPDISPTRSPTRSPTKKQTPVPVAAAVPDDIANITFSFENSTTSTTPGRKSVTAGSRKSTGSRKSLMPDWPQDEKSQVLTFFDQINPKETEQACIALTCKYAEMKYGQELPSKQLYQWVQKKGRVVNKPAPGTSYDLPEGERKETAVTLYRSLDTEFPENKRINFTCQYFQKQFGVPLTSKQLYDMLSDKGKKAKAGAGRRR